MGLTRRGYARLRGCSEKLVRRALASGRIRLEVDGSIDPKRADAAWPKPGPDAPARACANGRPKQALRPVSKQAVDAVRDTLAEAGEQVGQGLPADLDDLDGASITLTDAIKAKTIQQTYLARLKVMQMRQQQLVERERAEAYIYALFRQERDAWTSWPARISAQFTAELQAMDEIGQHGVHALLEQYVHEHLEELGNAPDIRVA